MSLSSVLGFQPGEASPGIITGSWAVSNKLASGSLDTQLGVGLRGHSFPQTQKALAVAATFAGVAQGPDAS